MKGKVVKVERFFDLHSVSEEEVKLLISGLCEIEANLKRPLSERIKAEQMSNQLIEILDESNSDGSEEVTEAKTKSLFEAFADVFDGTKRGFVPKAHMDKEWFNQNIQYYIGFLSGKAGQVAISVWNSKDDLENEVDPDYKIWLNKYCKDALVDFIESEGAYAVKMNTHNREGIFTASGYINSRGMRDYKKSFEIRYNCNSKIFTIIKDDISIELDYSHALLFTYFVDFHK